MTEPQGLGPATDISAADLDLDADRELTETSDPDAYDGDETLGGQGGADRTGGGAG
ncbi:MAG TPA: hypothetical protein VFR07_06985 [Mycobacteriales bacterium]|nr:hypothetical protein [Mycobacteriales bacterium]